MDTLKAIQVFVEIHQQGSLTKAAEKLALSRAMVSRYLEFLENRFGARLMQRNTRRVSLTQAGDEALAYCHVILEQEQKLQNLNAQKHMKGLIRVQANAFLSLEYLLDAVVAFQKNMPEVVIDVVLQEQPIDLIANNVDVSLRMSNRLTEGCETLPLGMISSWLVATPTYLAQYPKLHHPDQLVKHACLVHASLGESGSQWALIDANKQLQSYALGSVFRSNDEYALLAMVQRHQGVSVLPMDMVACEVASGRLVRVLPNWQVPVYQAWAVYVSKTHMPMMLQKFLEFLQQFFQQRQQTMSYLSQNHVVVD